MSEGKKDDNGKLNLSVFGLNFDSFCKIENTYNKQASWLVSSWWSDYKLKNNTDFSKLDAAIDQIRLNFLDTPEIVPVNTTKVFEFGKKKYGLLNYSKGFPPERLIAAFRRHIYWYPVVMRETVDPETGLQHEFHAICTILMLIENIMNGNIK